MVEEKRIKVLLAQPSLETHTRGLFTVASILKDAGMEVVLLGNGLPE
jgi:methylmalonyl-CoA mutase cobalamin-binding subunit